MAFAPAKVIELPDDRTETFCSAIRNTTQSSNINILVAVLPNNRKDRYDAIKKLCCVEVKYVKICLD